jgi:hypothetical protein
LEQSSPRTPQKLYVLDNKTILCAGFLPESLRTGFFSVKKAGSQENCFLFYKTMGTFWNKVPLEPLKNSVFLIAKRYSAPVFWQLSAKQFIKSRGATPKLT